MDNGTMSNRTLIANRERGIVIYMQCAIILDVCSSTYNDRRSIAAYDGVVPDTRALANSDVTNHHRAWRDKDILLYSGPNALVRQDGHDFLLIF